jgi:hypothetical protein
MNPTHRTFRRARLLALAALAAVSSQGAMAQTIVTSTWEGGNGNWAEATRWAPDGVPNNVPGEVLFIARVDGGNPTRSRLEIGGNIAILGLQHSAGDRITILDSSSLLITGNGFENDGDLRIEAPIPRRGAAATRLGFLTSTELKGSGEVTIGGDGFDYALLVAAPGAVLTNGQTHTIGGSGFLLQNSGALVNLGLVEANDPALPLRLQPGGAQNLPGGTFANVRNLGTLLATEGGTLALIGTVIENDGGTIAADVGSVVAFTETTVRGGSVKVEPQGEAQVTAGTSNVFADVSFDGNVTQFVSSSAVMVGTTTLTNTEWLIGAEGAASMNIADSGRIVGNGTLRLAPGGQSAILAGIPVVRGAAEVTIGNGVTVAGAGLLLDGTGNLVNDGRIVQDDTDGQLFIRPASRILNLGEIESTNSLGIELSDARIDQSFDKIPPGRMVASGIGSRIVLLDSGVYGGTMEGEGIFILRTNVARAEAGRGTPIMPPVSHVLSGVGILANMQQEGGAGVRVENTVTLDGNWTMQNELPGAVTFEDGAILTGDGTLTALPRDHFFRAARGARFSLAGDSFTFRGTGSFLDGAGTFENSGMFVSIGSDPPLVVSPEDSQPCTNRGTMGATGSATLVLARGSYDNFGGTIAAEPGGEVQLGNGVTVEGGVLEGVLDSSGGGPRGGTRDGLVRVFSGVTLRNLTLLGLSSFEPEQDGLSFRIGGTFNNSSAMSIDAVNTDTTFFFDDRTEIVGTGDITPLDNLIRPASARILAPITPTVKFLPDPTADPDTASMSIGVGQTINGGIQFFEGNSGLTNFGRLNANQTTDFIIQPNGLGFTNSGEVAVQDGSAFRILGASGAFNNMDTTPGSLDGGTYTIAGIFQTPDPIRTIGPGADVTLLASLAQLQDSAETISNGLLTEVAGGGSLAFREGYGHSTMSSFRNAGTLRISGSSSLDAANFEQAGANALLDFNSGSVSGGEIRLLGGRVTGNGGRLLSTAGVVVDGATVSPGSAGAGNTGILETSGGLRFGAAGVLEIDVANGLTFDQVTSDGDVTLGGTLRVRLAQPAAAGDSYLIIPATGSVSGHFGQFEVEGEIGNLQPKTRTTPAGVVLTFTARPSGYSVH